MELLWGCESQTPDLVRRPSADEVCKTGFRPPCRKPSGKWPFLMGTLAILCSSVDPATPKVGFGARRPSAGEICTVAVDLCGEKPRILAILAELGGEKLRILAILAELCGEKLRAKKPTWALGSEKLRARSLISAPGRGSQMRNHKQRQNAKLSSSSALGSQKPRAKLPKPSRTTRTPKKFRV